MDPTVVATIVANAQDQIEGFAPAIFVLVVFTAGFALVRKLVSSGIRRA